MAAKQIGELVVKLEAQTERFNRELDKARRHNKRLEKQLKTSRRAAQAFWSALKGPAAAAVAGLGLGAAIKQSIALGDAMAKASRRVGLSVEQFSSLQFAAAQAGVSSQNLELSLQRFARRAGEAGLNTGELKRALDVLNVPVRDAQGNLRSTSDLLEAFASKLVQVESPQERLALAVKAFDTEGAKMVELLPLLAGGFGDIEKAAAEAGAQIDTGTAEALERAQNRIDVFVKTATAALARIVGAGVQLVLPDLDEQIRRQAAQVSRFSKQLAAVIQNQQKFGGSLQTPEVRDLSKAYNEAREKLKGLNDERDRLINQKNAVGDALVLPPSGLSQGGGGGGRSAGGVPQFLRAPQRGLPGLNSIGEFRDAITDTQQVIVQGTEAAMGQFSNIISTALSGGEVRFQDFARNVVATIGQIVTSAVIAKFITGPLLNAIGITPQAAGGVHHRGQLQAFASGGVVSGPTLFPMARGMGLMGEAGPEAIMPLTRGKNGKLGVQASGQSSGVFAPSITINMNAPTNEAETPDRIGSEVRRQMQNFWRTQAINERRPGGMLQPLT